MLSDPNEKNVILSFCWGYDGAQWGELIGVSASLASLEMLVGHDGKMGKLVSILAWHLATLFGFILKGFGPPGHGSIPPTLWPYRAVAVDRDGLIGLATWCIIHENSWFESSMYVEVQCTAWQTWGKAPSHNEPKDTWQVGQHTFVKRIQIWFLKENRKMHLQCIGCSCCSSLQGQMYSTGRTLHHAAALGLTNISSPQTLRTGDFARCLRSSNSCPQSASEQGAGIRFWKCQVSETPPKRGWQALIANNPEKDHLTICRHMLTHWRSSSGKTNLLSLMFISIWAPALKSMLPAIYILFFLAGRTMGSSAFSTSPWEPVERLACTEQFQSGSSHPSKGKILEHAQLDCQQSKMCCFSFNPLKLYTCTIET